MRNRYVFLYFNWDFYSIINLFKNLFGVYYALFWALFDRTLTRDTKILAQMELISQGRRDKNNE